MGRRKFALIKCLVPFRLESIYAIEWMSKWIRWMKWINVDRQQPICVPVILFGKPKKTILNRYIKQ